MLNWFKRKPAPPAKVAPRDTLFGDIPLADWLDVGSDGEGWELFADVKDHLDAGEEGLALETLKKIVLHPALDSRDYLQAWHVLRRLGAWPHAARAKTLYGVVVEVGLEEGLDILGVYADKTARYYNFSGAGVVWGRPDASLDREIGALLSAGAEVVARIGRWDKERPPAPSQGQARINMLTPSGLHFGEGEFEGLAAHPLSGPVLTAASVLMKAMIVKTGKSVS
jgi:hypothetical protein